MADVPISLYTSVVKLTGENVAPPSLPPSLEETQPAINPPGTSDISGLVPYNGAIDNVNLGEQGLSTGFIQYDTTPTDTPTGSGTVVWNPDKYTLDLSMGLGDSVQQIGMETYYTPVKNQTGSLIPDGTFVMATGSLGASGRITVAPAVTDGSVDSRYMLGVTTHDIANGGDGLVTWFGEIRGFNTNTKAPVGETWVDGTVLWNNPAVAGGFTSVEPQAPNLKIPVAIVISAGNNGVIFVRPRLGMRLTDLHDVDAFTPSDKDLISYDSALGHWNAKSLGSVIGGTSSQFLKGDGSLDSNSYALASQINIASGQVAFGTGTNTITGSTNLTYSSGILTLAGTNGSVVLGATGDQLSFTRNGPVYISANGGASSQLYFEVNGAERWKMLATGVWQSNGAQTIQSSTGNLTLATAGGNGDIILNPNGIGRVGDFRIVGRFIAGRQSADGDSHFGSSGIGGTPTFGGQDYGTYISHNAFRQSDGSWKHSRTTILGASKLHVLGGGSTGLAGGFYFDYSPNVASANISWSTLMYLKTSGSLGILTTSPTNTIDVNGTARIRTIANATGDFVTASATGVLQKRTASETLADIGGIGGTIASGQVAFGTGVNTIGGDSGLIWDNVNKRLQIGSFSSGAFLQLSNSDTFNRPLGIRNLTGNNDFNIRVGTGGTVLETSGLQAIAFETNNIERARFLATGEFGINTTSPTNTLDVNGTARIRTLANATGDFVTASATGVLQKRTASETRTDIGAIGGTIASGQVAFGTGSGVIGGDSGLTWDNTSKFLQVRGDISTSGFKLVSKLNAGSNSNNSGAQIILASSTGTTGLSIYGGRTNASGGGGISVNSLTGGITKRVFYTDSNGDLIYFFTNDIERARFISTGEFGLNTTSPTNTLDVNGTARIRTLSNATGDFVTALATGVLQKRTAAETRTDIGAIGGTGTTNYIPKFTASGTIGNSAVFESGGNVGIGTSSPAAKFQVEANGSNIARFGDDFGNNIALTIENATGIAKIRYDQASDGAANKSLAFFAGTNERMRIDSSGKVGIGTSAPTNTLDVSGTARIRTLTGTTGYLPLLSSTGVMGQSVVYNTSAGSVLIGTINEVSGHKVRISGGALNITNWQSSAGAYDKLSIDFGETRGIGYDPGYNEVFFAGTTTVPVKIDTDAPTDSLNVLSTGGLEMKNLQAGTISDNIGLNSSGELVKGVAGVVQSVSGTAVDNTDPLNPIISVNNWTGETLIDTITLNDTNGNVTYTCNSTIAIYTNSKLNIKTLYLNITNIASSGIPLGGAFEIKGYNFYNFIGANDISVLYEVKEFRGTSYTESLLPLLRPDALGTIDGQLIFRKINNTQQQPPFTSTNGEITIKIAKFKQS